MSWYVLDAVDRAIERTRTCLIEPFDFWKWVKLALIVFFIGGSAGFNSGGNSSSYGDSYGGSEPDLSWIPNGVIDVATNAGEFAFDNSVMLVAGFIAFILLYAVIMGLIASVMEFVFVESLVLNEVRIIEYFTKYLGSGIALFILQIVLVILLMIPIAIVGALFITLIAVSGESDPSIVLMILMVPLVILAFILLIIVAGMIGSFVNMAVPVSIYTGSGIFSAFGNVFGQFRQDWKQMIIYWIGRTVLLIATGILLAILGLLGLILVGIILLIIDAVIYFVLMAIISETAVWLTFIPILIVELIFISFVMAFIGMPVKVFLKYHMLTFLQMWYPVDLPFFDHDTGSFVPEQMQIE